jgi:hypothetical protein
MGVYFEDGDWHVPTLSRARTPAIAMLRVTFELRTGAPLVMPHTRRTILFHMLR